MKRGKLTKTIFTIIVLASLLPMLVFGFFIAAVSKDILEKEFVEQLDFYNAGLSEDISVFLDKNKVFIDTFLEVHYLHDKSNIDQLHKDIGQFVNTTDMVSGLSFLDNNAKEAAYFGARARTDFLGDLPLIIKTTIDEQSFFIGSIHRNPVRKRLSIILSFPVKEGVTGKTTGALVGDFDMQPLANAFSGSVPKEFLTLVFTKGGFLIYSSSNGLATNISDDYRNKILMLSARAEEGKSVVMRSKEALGLITVDPYTGWILYVEQPQAIIKSILIDTLKHSYTGLFYMFGALIIMALILSMYISGLVTKPIKRMITAVKCVEDGNLSDMPSLPLPDNEIGLLSMAFAKMTDSLKIKLDNLEQDRQDLEELNQSLELRVGSRTKELKTALNEMIKKERLAAIGQMASIVSHEIKNPLAVMANSIYLIKARMGENADHKILKNITIMEEEIKQANGIIEEILGYARTRDQIVTTVDVNLYMKEILTSYPMPVNIEVKTEFEKQPLYVAIDSEEMKQAVRNLIGNAVEVMPQGGQLFIKTKKDGDKAILSIRDTGPGIPADIQEKIFAPFFTTKARGTGLGLAVVKKMAARNNADILLQSEPGKGTRMSIVLNIHKENN